MKLSILSMQRVVNFGSILQAYSLRDLIQEVSGETVDFIDIDPNTALHVRKTVEESVDYCVPADYPPGVLQKGKRWVISRYSAYNKMLIRLFMKKELKLSYHNNENQYDLVVVGSDEVFNHARGICLQLHGQIPQAKKVISYAASCGSALAEDIDIKYKEAVCDAMKNFSAISVRDTATKDYVKAVCGKEVYHHLDPVLTGNLYMRKHRPVRRQKYMLIYAYSHRIRTNEEINTIKALAKARGLKTVAVGASQFWCDAYVPLTPFRLMDYFNSAEMVVTDTFHGTIFSVIHHKEFAVISRPTNYRKIESLLNDLGLQNRRTKDIHDLEQIFLDKINYEKVEEILQRERKRTREYLREQLRGI